MESNAFSIFIHAAQQTNTPLPAQAVSQFRVYLQELMAWNKKINLTRITNPTGVVINHFLDSLVPQKFIPPESHVIDIGSGGGFPGIPLKLIRPDIQVTLVDASRKKVFFQRHIIRTLSLKGIEAIEGRVENLSSLNRFYGVCISRAFAPLAKYLASALALRAPKGIILAMKGPNFQRELDVAEAHIPFSGISMLHLETYVLPFTQKRRTIIVFGELDTFHVKHTFS